MKFKIAIGPFRSVKLSVLTLLLFFLFQTFVQAADSADPQLQQFKLAWAAAGKGDHEEFRRLSNDMQDYVLYPYLQYEDYRNRRASIASDEMVAFLDANEDLAFTNGLRAAWLKTLAKRGKWADLVKYSEGQTSTALRCQRARGQIILKQTDHLLPEAQKLWTSAKSQPDDCDPVFAWLTSQNGITTGLAWQRIRLAMLAGNTKLATYLKRFLPQDQQRWVDDWQKISRDGYSRLQQAKRWPDNAITRENAAVSIKKLARDNAESAAKNFAVLDKHFKWSGEERGVLLRDIALYAAVALEDDTVEQMERVPVIYRDSQLLEWWARYLLSGGYWAALIDVIGAMPEDVRTDDRWQYWLSQAKIRTGEKDYVSASLVKLADKANYYGFLAADELNQPYNICAISPVIEAAEESRIAQMPGFLRALELRKAGLTNWANEEWTAAIRRLPVKDMLAAAALAREQGWHDRAIFALGNSGDLQVYEWRFPLLWEQEIKFAAESNRLDPAWVYGTIRSESALVEAARSSANALGLMQITPPTGKRVAKKHGLKWTGSEQLKNAEGNLPIGTAFMRDLLDDYNDNPVLVSAAYNAGPNALERWLGSRPQGEAAIWVETLPYYETRDYIPRVLAFTTLYEWRLGGEVQRISNRMPHLESGDLMKSGNVPVMCREEVSGPIDLGVTAK
jgi:soluble lytic murein transglycosylase